MTTRAQIQQIVKLFGFKKRQKDCYELYLTQSRIWIYLYYFQDKPKGWRLQLNYSLGDDRDEEVHILNKPIALIVHLANFITDNTRDRTNYAFKRQLHELQRTL